MSDYPSNHRRTSEGSRPAAAAHSGALAHTTFPGAPSRRRRSVRPRAAPPSLFHSLVLPSESVLRKIHFRPFFLTSPSARALSDRRRRRHHPLTPSVRPRLQESEFPPYLLSSRETRRQPALPCAAACHAAPRRPIYDIFVLIQKIYDSAIFFLDLTI